MKNLYAKNFDDADEVKNPPKAKAQIVRKCKCFKNCT